VEDNGSLLDGARGGVRTRTPLTGKGGLSPPRLPVPPPGLGATPYRPQPVENCEIRFVRPRHSGASDWYLALVARVSTYLNFAGSTMAAFDFYREVFGTEFTGPVMRMRDVPVDPDGPSLSDDEADLVMHVELPILGGHVLMGTDVVDSMGHRLVPGNNVIINLEPDTRGEADRLHAALSAGSTESMGMFEQFWGDYWGSCTDLFGVNWMINCSAAA
jgi:PhnB protein